MPANPKEFFCEMMLLRALSDFQLKIFDRIKINLQLTVSNPWLFQKLRDIRCRFNKTAEKQTKGEREKIEKPVSKMKSRQKKEWQK